MPILSIIVPTYNCCEYLKPCIEKLLKLESNSIEIIVVNDGSKDTTKEYLDSIESKDSRLKIIHQPNGGVSSARNNALSKAQGKYLFFSDSDDEIIPETFEKVIELLKNDNLDLVVANFLNENADLKSTRVYYHRTRTGQTSGALFLKYSLENKEYGSEIYQYFFKRSLFSGIQFVPGILHEDDQVLPRVIFKAKEALVLNQNIYYRKYRLDSLSRDAQAKPRNNAKDLLFVIETFSKEIREYNSSLARSVFKTLQLRSWMMIFDFFNKVPEKKELSILEQRPSIIEVLLNRDLSMNYRFKYLGRVLKLK